MLNTAAQSITKKAPQQAARIQRSITSDAFSFYPVRKTRYDQVITTSMAPQQQQQVARINTTAAAQAENHSFAFYPVQKNRVRKVTPKTNTNRDCYGYYPINNERKLQAATIQDAKAVRDALKQQKQSTKIVKQNWDSVMQEMRAAKTVS